MGIKATPFAPNKITSILWEYLQSPWVTVKPGCRKGAVGGRLHAAKEAIKFVGRSATAWCPLTKPPNRQIKFPNFQISFVQQILNLQLPLSFSRNLGPKFVTVSGKKGRKKKKNISVCLYVCRQSGSVINQELLGCACML